MNNVINIFSKKPKRTPHPSNADEELEQRILRICQSIQRINQLMAELCDINKEKDLDRRK